jgi:uncharacterized protein
MRDARLGLPDLGVGVGLRVPHYPAIFGQRPAVDFFEIISENFMVEGGKPLYHLDRVLESYRVVQHGVSLAIGGPAEPDREYLVRLKRLLARVGAPWLSDHFCWGGVPGATLHDLLPLPHTSAAIRRVSERAREVQDFLERPLVLENASSYLQFSSSSMPEWEFIGEIAERAEIGLLFDVNNVYVSAFNHGFDPYEFVRNVPHHRIVQIHLAGHTNLRTHIVDTHDGHVIDPVWDLYRETIELTGSVSTLIEWDDRIPELKVLLEEADRARRVRDAALVRRALRLAGREPPPIEPIAMPRPAASSSPLPAAARSWNQGGPRELAANEP